MKQIGVVGAGIMASGMVQNFLKHGYTVHVWNRSTDRLKPLMTAGAKVSDSPKTLTEKSDIIIECVADDEASRSVWLGDNGILAGAMPEKVLITSASLSLDWTDELVELCAQKRFKFLDMPLTGSRKGAETGTLKLLVGGDEAVLDEIRPELAAIADKIYHFGKNGSGMRFKLILNTLQAIQIDAAAQAIELAKKVGLDVGNMHDAIFDAPLGPASPATNIAFQADTIDQTNFAVNMIEKDLRYAKIMAQQNNMTFDLLNDTQAAYKQVKDKGLGESDWSKIIELYRD